MSRRCLQIFQRRFPTFFLPPPDCHNKNHKWLWKSKFAFTIHASCIVCGMMITVSKMLQKYSGRKFAITAVLLFDFKANQQSKEQRGNCYFVNDLGNLVSLNECFGTVLLDYILDSNFHQYSQFLFPHFYAHLTLQGPGGLSDLRLHIS